MSTEQEVFRDKISTVDPSGNRIWIYPKKPVGWFYERRKIVSYVLLLVLFVTPFIKFNGEPVMLFNMLEGKFILFGIYFAPQDFHLFVIAMLIGIVFIALFTAVFGRVFCGWVCPQTIFMEMVFRRLEYWIDGDAGAQKRLAKRKWDTDKTVRRVAKYAIFLIISSYIAHTFLAYIIGVDEVINIVTEPVSEHVGGFIAMVIFTLVFFFVFARLREQVCTTICPYGRLQGVLLDDKSLAVAYDFVRGEPRGKIRKNRGKKPEKTRPDLGESTTGHHVTQDHKNFISETEVKVLSAPNENRKGDCIDCHLCVQVCPTGIDIRDGIQLECVNCTACMDACDEVMVKIDRPTGLIRIDSLNRIIGKTKSLWNTRVAAYTAVLIALIGLESFLLINRSDVEALLLRTPGMLYQEPEEGMISNLYNYQLINKSDKSGPVTFTAPDAPYIIFETVGDSAQIAPRKVTEGALFIKIPADRLSGRKNEIKVIVKSGDEIIDDLKTNFLGPVK